MEDVAVRLEHVDLVNGLDGLGAELLEAGLELAVVGSGAGGGALDLAAGGTLATVRRWLAMMVSGEGYFGEGFVGGVFRSLSS